MDLPKAIVKTPSVNMVKPFRKGKGFSLKELITVNLSVKMARKLGLSVDTRRRTSYEENIRALQEFTKIIKIKKKVVKKQRVKAKKEVVESELMETAELIELSTVKGVGKVILEKLNNAGITSTKELLEGDLETIVEESDVSRGRLEKIREAAQQAVEETLKEKEES